MIVFHYLCNPQHIHDMIIRHILLYAALAVTAMTTMADVTIVEHITADSRNKVVQPEALRQLLVRQENAAETEEPHGISAEATASTSSGYRVQVFLDNNPRTAKATARRKASAISSRFPEMRTYITYNSPYWRLRVGDFRSHAEASEAAAELRSAFPGSAKEVRVVRDRINR